MLQIKAEFKSIDLHSLLVWYIFYIKHNGPTLMDFEPQYPQLKNCGPEQNSMFWAIKNKKSMSQYQFEICGREPNTLEVSSSNDGSAKQLEGWAAAQLGLSLISLSFSLSQLEPSACLIGKANPTLIFTLRQAGAKWSQVDRLFSLMKWNNYAHWQYSFYCTQNFSTFRHNWAGLGLDFGQVAHPLVWLTSIMLPWVVHNDCFISGGVWEIFWTQQFFSQSLIPFLGPIEKKGREICWGQLLKYEPWHCRCEWHV